MACYKILIAVAVLTNADPSKTINDPGGLHPHLAPIIQKVAIYWEIMDSRETKHILNDPGYFVEDLRELQKRFKELSDAPIVVECLRFPEREMVNDFLTANRLYQEELRKRLDFDRVHHEEIRMALQETERLYRIWDRVQESRRKFYYITVRRRALKELRELVGATAFYSGQLPPPVPLWRLTTID